MVRLSIIGVITTPARSLCFHIAKIPLITPPTTSKQVIAVRIIKIGYSANDSYGSMSKPAMAIGKTVMSKKKAIKNNNRDNRPGRELGI